MYTHEAVDKILRKLTMLLDQTNLNISTTKQSPLVPT